MKLFGSDYDGTMCVAKQYEEGLNDAIKAFQAAGNKFGIVTGRSLGTLEHEVKVNQIPVDFLVSNNGGIVKIDGKLLYEALFDFSTIETLVEDLRHQDILGYVLNNGVERSKKIIVECDEMKNYGVQHYFIEEADLLSQQKVAQIVVVVKTVEEGKQLAAYLNHTYQGKLSAFSNINCVDIVPYEVSKANGLAKVADYFGIDEQAIYCIGDGGNDLPMLVRFNGATMHHASGEMHEEISQSYPDVKTFLEDITHA